MYFGCVGTRSDHRAHFNVEWGPCMFPLYRIISELSVIWNIMNTMALTAIMVGPKLFVMGDFGENRIWKAVDWACAFINEFDGEQQPFQLYSEINIAEILILNENINSMAPTGNMLGRLLFVQICSDGWIRRKVLGRCGN